MTSRLPARCLSCEHFRSDGKCDAFPDSIPEDIYVWGADHALPIDGQGNFIVYQFDGLQQDELDEWNLVFGGKIELP